MKYLNLIFCLVLPFQIFASGRLIEVCGIDGSGKTTFVQDLYKALSAKGQKVVKIKPLSGNPIACSFLEEIDELEDKIEHLKIQGRVNSFKSEYFFLELINTVTIIQKYLSEGYDVICDRYLFSFRTYQECFNQKNLDHEAILKILPQADVTFLISVPVSLAVSRIEQAGKPAFYENSIFLGKAQEIFFRDMLQYNPIEINGEDDRSLNIEKALNVLRN